MIAVLVVNLTDGKTNTCYDFTLPVYMDMNTYEIMVLGYSQEYGKNEYETERYALFIFKSE